MGVPVDHTPELMAAKGIRGSAQSRLHNFSFPTSGWGQQRLLRCSKPPVSDISVDERRSPPLQSPSSSSWFLEETAYRSPMQDQGGGGKEESGEHDEASPSVAAGNAKPWNLRKRRAGCSYSKDVSENKKNPNKDGETGRLLRSGHDGPVKGDKRKLSVSLSWEEIEEDFYALTGTRPARRPKKRPKVVQKQFDSLSPGFWLSGFEITEETYKVSK